MRKTRMTIAERLETYTDKSGGEHACWIWKGPSRSVGGYGYLRVGGKNIRAHRAMWEHVQGPIPDNLHVCHTCDNPPCVNPAHLFLGTRSDNMRDMVRKGRNRGGTIIDQRGKECPTIRGELHPLAKLTDAQVVEIRALLREGILSQKQIAMIYGVGRTAMSDIARGRTWKHIP